MLSGSILFSTLKLMLLSTKFSMMQDFLISIWEVDDLSTYVMVAD